MCLIGSINHKESNIMAFERIATLDAEKSISLGGMDKKSGKPNPKSVEGYYLGTKTGIPNKFNPEKPDCQHVLQTKDGLVGVWGKSHLNPQMAKAIPGCMVRITFTGTRPSKKGNDQLLFAVEQDKTNNIAVDADSNDGHYASSQDAAEEYETDYTESLEEEETVADELPPVRASRPASPASAPDPKRQAAVQALLNRSKKTA